MTSGTLVAASALMSPVTRPATVGVVRAIGIAQVVVLVTAATIFYACSTTAPMTLSGSVVTLGEDAPMRRKLAQDASIVVTAALGGGELISRFGFDSVDIETLTALPDHTTMPPRGPP